MLLLLSADFFKTNLFKKFFQEHNQFVKEFGSKSGPTFCLLFYAPTTCDLRETTICFSDEIWKLHCFNPQKWPTTQTIAQEFNVGIKHVFFMHKHLLDPEGGVEAKPEKQGFYWPPRGHADVVVSEKTCLIIIIA